jgi:hypothetical protein
LYQRRQQMKKKIPLKKRLTTKLVAEDKITTSSMFPLLT